LHHRLAVAATLLVALTGTMASEATSNPNWIVVAVTAGASGADELIVRISSSARISGEDPALVGFGVSDRSSSLVDVIPAGSGAVRLTSTDAAGGLDVTVIPGSGERELMVSSTLLYDVLRPLERVTVLVFAPGMTFEDLTVDEVSATSGSLSSWTLTGDGAASVSAAGPADEGIAASAGPAAVGSNSRHHRQVQDGLVGGFVTSGYCMACSGSWRAPDGSGGSFRSTEAGVGGLTSGRPAFAGAQGAWTWTWSGLGLTYAASPGTVPVVAAYAPIGEAWPLFRPLGI